MDISAFSGKVGVANRAHTRGFRVEAGARLALLFVVIIHEISWIVDEVILSEVGTRSLFLCVRVIDIICDRDDRSTWFDTGCSSLLNL
jgi:hypothetical protein